MSQNFHKGNQIVLTIAIPTYNRNYKLINNLKLLIPQINHNCELLILDNNSDISVENSITESNLELNKINFRLIKNQCNIGAGANLLKCFEYAHGEWIWILGDDDKPKIRAIETIFYYINYHQDAINIVFDYCVNPRNNEIIANGFDKYLSEMDNFGKSLFISMNIYRAEIAKKYIGIAQEYIYSRGPQQSVLFSMLLKENNAKFVMAQKDLVDWEIAPIDERWNNVFVGFHMLALLEHPSLNFKQTKKLAKFIDRDYVYQYRHWLPGAIVLSNQTQTRNETLLFVHELLFRYKKLRFNIFRIIAHRFLYLLVIISPATLFFLSLYLKIIKSKYSLSVDNFPPMRNRL